jgi:hypothetical protein
VSLQPLRRRRPFIGTVPAATRPLPPRRALVVGLAASLFPRGSSAPLPPPGAVFSGRVPARTVRLAPFQVKPLVVRPAARPPLPIQPFTQTLAFTAEVVSGGGFFVTDTFTGTSGTLLENHHGEIGATWTRYLGVTPNATLDAANRLYATTNTGNGTIYSASGLPPQNNADYDVDCTWIVAGAGASVNAILARFDISQPSLTAYTLAYDRTSNFWVLSRYTAGTGTLLGSFAETLATNDVRTVIWQLRGSTLNVYINSVLRITATDTQITGAFRVGVWLNGVDTTTTGVHLDDFNAVSTAVSAARPALLIRPPVRPAAPGRTILPRRPNAVAAPVVRRVPPSLIVRPVVPPSPGALFRVKLPDRTLRLDAFQEDATVIRRDERRSAGAVWLSPPHRTTFSRPAKTPTVARRDERRFAGAVYSVKVPDRTVRLDSFQEDALVVRSDQRGWRGLALFSGPRRPTLTLTAGETRALIVRRDERCSPGTVLLNKVPGRTVRLESFQEDAIVLLRPYPEPRRGQVWIAAPHRDTTPRPAKRPLIALSIPPRLPGSVFTVRVPARTLRLESFQLDVIVVRRDERGFTGRVLIQSPSRTGAAVIVPRTPALIGPIRPIRPISPIRGAVFLVRGPARTLRLDAFQEGALVARRDERRYAGTLFLNKVPARTVRLDSFQEDALVLLRPASEPRRGQVWIGRPHPDTAPRPAKGAWVLRPVVPPAPGTIFRVKLPDRTLRLDSFQEDALVIRRDERAFTGRILMLPPTKTGTAVIIPRLPKVLVVRRDERGFAGRGLVVRIPDRTLRLDAFQERALVARRDERRYAGSIWLNKVPARTVRLDSFQEDALVLLRPASEPRRGQVWIGRPHPDTSARPAKTSLIIRPVVPPAPGALFRVKLPDRTLRLDAFQEAPRVVRRDERAFTGRIILLPPTKTGAAVLVPRLPRQLIVRRDERAFVGARYLVKLPDRTLRLEAFQERPLVVARDERRFAGAVWMNRVPDRTLRLDSFQTAALVRVPPAPEPRRGSVWSGRPHSDTTPRPAKAALVARPAPLPYRGAGFRIKVPGRTSRLPAGQTTALVVRRDERRGAGAVWLATFRRPVVVASAIVPRTALLVRQTPPFPRVQPILLATPRRLTLRLSAGQTTIRISARQSFPFGGAVLFVRPNRPQVIPRLPRHLVTRRDERGFAGRAAGAPVSRQNAVAVLHGNPRAKVTLRAAPTAAVVLRPQPTATLVFLEG